MPKSGLMITLLKEDVDYEMRIDDFYISPCIKQLALLYET